MKDVLRASARTRALYLRCMGVLGVFPGVPTQAETAGLYARQLQRRSEMFARLGDKQASAKIAVVIIDRPEDQDFTRSTLASIGEQSRQPDAVVVWRQGDQEQKVTPEISETNAFSLVCGDAKALAATLSNVVGDDCGGFFINAGDQLKSDSVEMLARLAKDDLSCIFYVDTDSTGEAGELTPKYYPAWNPDLQLSTAYVRTGLWLPATELQSHLLDVTEGPEAIALLLIRTYLQDRYKVIRHLPLVLVAQPETVSFGLDRFNEGVDRALVSAGKAELAEQGNRLIVHWNVSPEPLVSIVIPTRNAKDLVQTCIDSIVTKTTYPNYEIILVSNNTDDPACAEYFSALAERGTLKLLHYNKPFNYSAINNFAVSHVKGSVLAFLNNDIEVISPDWLTFMVGHALRSDIGGVGAKLLYPDNRVQHAGVVMGYGGGAGHAHKYYPRDHQGYLQRLAATNNYSAVTAACMLIERNKFEAIGGFNEQNLAVAFNDVDLCLRLTQAGLRNVYCAEAVLYHHESISRGAEDTAEKQRRFQGEVDFLKTQWQCIIQADPAYHPALTLMNEGFGLGEPEAINFNSLVRLR
ncbi:glycosyltransferase family 2 protein [Simiduia agarivorans]|nr:glycosyltransferase family 2 protein [Simiduia agarivorans]